MVPTVMAVHDSSRADPRNPWSSARTRHALAARLVIRLSPCIAPASGRGLPHLPFRVRHAALGPSPILPALRPGRYAPIGPTRPSVARCKIETAQVGPGPRGLSLLRSPERPEGGGHLIALEAETAL